MQNQLITKIILLGSLSFSLSALADEVSDATQSAQSPSPSQFEVRNYSDLRLVTGIDRLQPARNIKNKMNRPIRVAILDQQFEGYEKADKTLAANTKFIDLSVNKEAGSAHGLMMAQIFWSFMTDNGYEKIDDVELFLISSTGYSDFVKAVDFIIDENIDIVLHSIVRDYGGNFDGKGFFNQELNRATEAGVLWFNAAGNFGQSAYNFKNIKINTNADGWLKLPGPNQSLPLRCSPIAPMTTCQTRIVISWNDFSDDVETGSNKDLDLVLTDDTLNILQGSALVQKADDMGNEPGTSKYPREILDVTLKPGRYFIRIKNRSQNFTPQDQVRIAVDDIMTELEFFDRNENLMILADNPSAITVGASDSDRSSRSVKLRKPEVYAPSIIEVSDQEQYAGSSNAAAITAARATLLLMRYGPMNRTQMLNYLNR